MVKQAERLEKFQVQAHFKFVTLLFPGLPLRNHLCESLVTITVSLG